MVGGWRVGAQIYNDSIPWTGWATLEVHTVPGIPDEVAAYAAGFVEGAVTSARSVEFINNALAAQGYGNGLAEFLGNNTQWVLEQAHVNPADPFW